MSGQGGLLPFGREFLLALRSEPLDVYQLAAKLSVIPVAVEAELEGLIGAGLVHAVTMENGRQAWGLTFRGRSRVPARGEL